MIWSPSPFIPQNTLLLIGSSKYTSGKSSQMQIHWKKNGFHSTVLVCPAIQIYDLH